MKRTRELTIAVGGLLIFSSLASAATRYAKVSATGSGNCTSWANACTLSSAILAAQFGDDVWVKMETYAPFNLKDGVRIIGGFAGTETLASQSNPANNVTVVDGGGDERCVKSYNVGPSTMLRGFKIANGRDIEDDHGGGAMFLQDSSPTIVNCIFEYNTAAYLGGAVVVYGYSAPQFVNCIFRYNGTITGEGPYEGGAIHQWEGWLTVVNCLFHDNKAGSGGAVWLGWYTLATFTNCTFAENEATIGRGGGVKTLTDATFHNCTFWANIRHDNLNPPSTYFDQISATNVVATVTYSDVQGGWPGTGNINADPLFQNPATGNYELQSTSPCKNVGENAALPPDVGDLDCDGNTSEAIPLDLARFTRILSGTVDQGAYEFGCQNASTDCNQNGVLDACDIESDPTLDCHNQNGVLDLCEIGVVPRGACCLESTCVWPTTSCGCAASDGVWNQGMKCFQINCAYY